MSSSAHAGARAERTRHAILDAAERLFAENGFAATRLEDIAEQVGIRRASMVYHFKDKRELHTAVLARVIGGLDRAIRSAARMDLAPAERIDAAVSAWVDYVAGRPSTARILLREIASAGRELPPGVLEAADPLASFIREAFVYEENLRAAMRAKRPGDIHAVHVASTIAGATLFYVAAMPLIHTRTDFQPLEPRHVEVHKRDMLRITHQLLGLEAR